MKKISFLFLVFCLSFSASAHALKILGFGSNEYDVVFTATPISLHVMKPGEAADAIEGSLDDQEPRTLVSFHIERVLMGEFQQHRRGGPSRFTQASDAVKNGDVLNVVSFNFKNPEDMMDRETIRIAVKDPGASFGLTPGADIAYFEHKIYLKRASTQQETFLFIKSKPLPSRDKGH